MKDCFCTKTYQCLACERGEQRKQAIAEGRKIERKVAQCGTRAGYNRHLRQGEATCDACKAAQLEAVLAYKRAKAG